MGYKWVYDENHILTKIYRRVFGLSAEMTPVLVGVEKNIKSVAANKKHDY